MTTFDLNEAKRLAQRYSSAVEYDRLAILLMAACEEVESKERELEKVRALLADMVNQHCFFRENGKEYFFHMFMGANEDAFEYLEQIGWMKSNSREEYAFTAAASARRGEG